MMIYIDSIVTKVYLFIWNYLVMIKLTFKSLLLILIPLFISGCGELKRLSLSQICEDAPGICDDLHIIGDCRYQRTSLIRARYEHLQEPNVKNTQLLLEELDGYKACLEPTLHIAYTRYKDRKQKRLDNYLASQKVIEQLLSESVGTQDPNLAYYLWVNYKDLKAKKVFLNAANQPNLSDTSLLIKLGVYYSSDEPQKSIDFYYKALRETNNIESLPSNTFLQLVTFFYRHRLYEETYIWAKVALDTSEEPTPIRLEMITKKANFSEKKQSQLNKKAKKYISDLKDGLFNQKTPVLDLAPTE